MLKFPISFVLFFLVGGGGVKICLVFIGDSSTEEFFKTAYNVSKNNSTGVILFLLLTT